MLKDFILYIWQLPQNIIGLIVILITRAFNCGNYYVIKNHSATKWFGISLGKYIIFGDFPIKRPLQHEQGHQKQSLYLGWLYLLIIGLPSVFRRIYQKMFKKNNIWYYSGYPEKWADRLGGVEK